MTSAQRAFVVAAALTAFMLVGSSPTLGGRETSGARNETVEKAPPSVISPYTTWKSLSGASYVSPSDVLGAARTSIGSLVVAWIRRNPSHYRLQDLMATTISPAGKIVETRSIVHGWDQINSVALVKTNDGIRAFFNGFRTADAGDPLAGVIASALLTSTQTPWSLSPGPVANNNYAYTGNVAATVDLKGQPFVAWEAPGTFGVHLGLNANEVQDPIPVFSGDGSTSPVSVNTVWGRGNDGKAGYLVGYCTTSGHYQFRSQGVSVEHWPPVRNYVDSVADRARCDALNRVPLVAGPRRLGSHVYAAFVFEKVAGHFLGSGEIHTLAVQIAEVDSPRGEVGPPAISWDTAKGEDQPDTFKAPALATDPRNGDVWLTWAGNDPDDRDRQRVHVLRYDRDLNPTAGARRPWFALPKGVELEGMEISDARCGDLDVVARLIRPTGRTYLAYNRIHFPSREGLCKAQPGPSGK